VRKYHHNAPLSRTIEAYRVTLRPTEVLSDNLLRDKVPIILKWIDSGVRLKKQFTEFADVRIAKWKITIRFRSISAFPGEARFSLLRSHLLLLSVNRRTRYIRHEVKGRRR